MTWTTAPAIKALQRTLDQARPGRRDRYPDGTIGDADHSARDSDHNPDVDRMVCAVDVHDSDQLDDGDLYASIKMAGARNPVKYAINAGRIWSPDRGERRYTGINAHADHCHISVTQAGKRQPADWWLPGITDRVKAQSPDPEPLEEFVMASKDEVRALLDEQTDTLTGGVRRRDPEGKAIDPDKEHVSIADVLTAQEVQGDRIVAALDRLTAALKGKP